jgi:IS30 family transposase
VARVGRKQADFLAAMVISVLKLFGLPIHTLTLDKGKEFAHHEIFTRALDVRFFCPSLRLMRTWAHPAYFQSSDRS